VTGTCQVCGRPSTVFLRRPDGTVAEYCAPCIANTYCVTCGGVHGADGLAACGCVDCPRCRQLAELSEAPPSDECPRCGRTHEPGLAWYTTTQARPHTTVELREELKGLL
jgi:ssDNA-binding Zn-finger/Zn-ribbon topoisomerase 1